MQTRTASALALAVAFTFGGGFSHAVELGKSGKPLTAQQLRMKHCNADARTQDLHGDARKAFMKACLRGETATTANPAGDDVVPAMASAEQAEPPSP